MNASLDPISHAKTILQAILVPTMHRLMRYRTMHYELIPA